MGFAGGSLLGHMTVTANCNLSIIHFEIKNKSKSNCRPFIFEVKNKIKMVICQMRRKKSVGLFPVWSYHAQTITMIS